MGCSPCKEWKMPFMLECLCVHTERRVSRRLQRWKERMNGKKKSSSEKKKENTWMCVVEIVLSVWNLRILCFASHKWCEEFSNEWMARIFQHVCWVMPNSWDTEYFDPLSSGMDFFHLQQKSCKILFRKTGKRGKLWRKRKKKKRFQAFCTKNSCMLYAKKTKV